MYHTTFCMPTASRSVSYVAQVVRSYASQNVFQMDGIVLMILDTDNSSAGNATALQSRVVEICSVDAQGLPPCRVRQQGLDVTASLLQCADFTSGWVVLVEDDCEVCAGGLDEVVYTLSNLHTDEIAMAKFSKFVRATAFPARMVPRYAKSVRERLNTHPYDVTRIEEWAPGKRQYIHHRNLFHHIGYVSTVETRNDNEYRLSYEALRSDVCFEKM